MQCCGTGTHIALQYDGSSHYSIIFASLHGLKALLGGTVRH
jgi:hypothetical protein